MPRVASITIANRAFLIFVCNFCAGKGLAFLGPIGIALLVQAKTYSDVEFSLASAQIIALIITAGIPSSVMQLVLIQNERVADILLLSSTVICTFLLLVSFSFLLILDDFRWPLLTGMACLTVIQQTGVAYARAYGLRNVNVWVDHLPTIVAIIAASAAIVTKWNEIKTIYVLVISCTITISLWGSLLARASYSPDTLKRMRNAVVIGAPMMLSTIVGAWLVTSGRIYATQLLLVEESYAYAFVFRVSSAMALVNAFVITAFAPQLYRLKTKHFDETSTYIILTLAIISFSIMLFEPFHPIARYLSIHNSQLLLGKPVESLIAAQIFFWMSGSIVEMRINRFRMSGDLARINVIIAIITMSIITTIYYLRVLTLTIFVILMVAQQMSSCYAMHFLLLRRKIHLRGAFWMTLAATIVLLSYAYVRMNWWLG